MAINLQAASFAACLAGLKVPPQIMYCIAQGEYREKPFVLFQKQLILTYIHDISNYLNTEVDIMQRGMPDL